MLRTNMAADTSERAAKNPMIRQFLPVRRNQDEMRRLEATVCGEIVEQLGHNLLRLTAAADGIRSPMRIQFFGQRNVSVQVQQVGGRIVTKPSLKSI
ncbi:hypothetical protein BV898_02223 [Hypsibius exemplaris]|uniref:Uncharacterized protein n=1 Tax=Hypsibius exemplaris TaxID=2072580 RepID=A0A1W0X902_HYPEX|nr:hypothetical protein BV898_02223 [Hypsibius exemplaris]